MNDIAETPDGALDPAIRILKYREQPTNWLSRRTGNRITVSRARRVLRGQRAWTLIERSIIADAFDIPEDVIWPSPTGAA